MAEERAQKNPKATGSAPAKVGSASFEVKDGAVLIAAITSCTNTSNPAVMVASGLLARNALKQGLNVKPWVKTSLAPGSRVVTDYLAKAGLLKDLEALGFYTVGYGCTTCIAAGTPVLLANGTSRKIEQLPEGGGSVVYAPDGERRLARAVQREMMIQGERECVTLVLQDGRTLVCTPDHRILCADGRWVRADQLTLGQSRVVTALEAPLDEPSPDEIGFRLQAAYRTFSMESGIERQCTLAFARLVGHLLSDGSISRYGQARMCVGQALDREAVLSDIELLSGQRPLARGYGERKRTVVLPKTLTSTILSLPGVRVGRRIDQEPGLPQFVLDGGCPVAVVREFLGGLFGADGHAPVLHYFGKDEHQASLEPPAYSQSAKPEFVPATIRMMNDIIKLLVRCGVKARGATVYEYPTRFAASTYPAARDGVARQEIRLELPEGLSFVERVGFRYCVDKALRASAAAVYWRTIDSINRQRLWMADRLEALHGGTRLSFHKTRSLAAADLTALETPVFPHYSLLEGHDRFTRLPSADARPFRPLHRESCEFPSPAPLFRELGVRDWVVRAG